MTIDGIEDAEALHDYASWFNQIDYEVAREEVCPKHDEHCRYAGFTRGQSRRAFVYCPLAGCDYYQEF